MGKKRRHFPKLREYLEHEHRSSPLERADGWLVGLGVGGSIVSLVVGGIATAVTDLPVMMVGSLVGLAAVWTAFTVVYRRTYAPKDPVIKSTIEAHKAARTMLGHVRGRRLHRHMDTPTAEVLEACAFHWSRIRHALDTPAWNREVLEGHWLAVREQASRAADEAMLEAIYLSRSSLSDKRISNTPDFLEWAEDFFEVDVEDLLKKIGVKQGEADSDEIYGYQPALLRPLHQIGTKLRSLAEELEQAPAPVLRLGGTRQPAASSIDLALSEIGSLKKAELELDDSIQQRLGH